MKSKVCASLWLVGGLIVTWKFCTVALRNSASSFIVFSPKVH